MALAAQQELLADGVLSLRIGNFLSTWLRAARL